jgi:hypothetical protein
MKYRWYEISLDDISYQLDGDSAPGSDHYTFNKKIKKFISYPTILKRTTIVSLQYGI